MTAFVRLLRWLGAAALLGSIGVAVGAILWQAARGPVADQALWPSPRLWGYFGRSLLIATTACMVSLLVALPALLAHVGGGRRFAAALWGLTLVPLFTMPSIHAYAWILLATQDHGPVGPLLRALGWMTPGFEPLQAAWAQAMWLWPIPTLVLLAAWRREAAAAFELGLLDAPAGRAALRAALPALRGPLVAALAAVFILSLQDGTIAPLMQSRTWTAEMMANALIASKYDRPAAYMAWANWPLVATLAMVFALALPGLRRMTGWLEIEPNASVGPRVPTSIVAIASLVIVLIVLVPPLALAGELLATHVEPHRALLAARHTVLRQGAGTGVVALAVGLLSIFIAMTCLTARGDRLGLRFAAAAAAGCVVLSAMLTPEMTGPALISTYATITNPAHWNLYDNTPWVWIAGLLARYAFLPVCVALVAARRATAAADQAAVDGATPLESLAHVTLPRIAPSLAVAALAAACFALTDVTTSVLVQTPGFFSGSLAVRVDQQMHFGRNAELTATSLFMLIPSVLTAGIVGGLGFRRRQG